MEKAEENAGLAVEFPGYGSVSGRAIDGGQPASSLSFHDVSYVVTQGIFKKTSKVVLNNLS